MVAWWRTLKYVCTVENFKIWLHGGKLSNFIVWWKTLRYGCIVENFKIW
jgi:hypothetical protein